MHYSNAKSIHYNKHEKSTMLISSDFHYFSTNGHALPLFMAYHPFSSFFISMIAVVVVFPIATTSITELEALLQLKKSFTNYTTALDSWRPGTEPCAPGNRAWAGVTCKNGAVSGIHLGHWGLSGDIDVDALASLAGLRSIALVSNAFSGPIPGFHRVPRLRGLYISDNRFSGEIPPDYFSNIPGLKKVWLSRNNFSGPIPSSLARLSRLVELHLENNRFSGSIPPFGQQSLVSLDVSYNKLEGDIPQALSKFSPGAFAGNPGLCGNISGNACSKSSVKKLKKVEVTISCLVAFFVLLSLTLAGIYTMKHKNKTCDERATENLDIDPLSSVPNVGNKDIRSSRRRFGSLRGGSSRRGDLEVINNEKGTFGMGDLLAAAAEVLGTGALGSTYKATMTSGFTVVVKKMTEISKIGRDTFDVIMGKFGKLENKNVLTPLAYHYRKDDKLLVYEYQNTGSLMFLLHGDRGIPHSNLNWPVRLNIIRGIASGLSYLHAELSSLDLPHGNLKSSNVLLRPDYEPLLVDYGLCSLISRSQAAQTLMAYKAPEAILDHNISPKCDVYCLGIIILEILTGRFPAQYLNNSRGGADLVQWVRLAIGEGRVVELLDPDIANCVEFVSEMERLLHIGADCTEKDPNRRLDLREAIRRIELGLCSTASGVGDVEANEVLQPPLRDGIDEPRVELHARALGDSNDHSRRTDSVGDQYHSGRSFYSEIP